MANYLIEQLYRQTDKYRDTEFCRFREPGQIFWKSTSRGEFLDDVERAACALQAIGLGEKEMVGICTPNRPQALQAELALFFHRGCGVPIYAYCSQEQFNFVMLRSGAKVVFVGAREQYRLAQNFLLTHPGVLSHIILLFDSSDIIDASDRRSLTWTDFLALGDKEKNMPAVKERMERGEPSDLASLIYTSGTTGDPKGVMLSHSNFDAAVKEHLKRLPEIVPGELSLSFLPMSHVFEKAWTFFCMVKGLRIAFNYDPRNIESTLHEVNPNLMCCVPRFWEKIYTAIVTKMQSMSPLARLAIKRAMAVGARMNLHYKRKGMRAPWYVRKEYDFWDRKLFSVVRREIGIPCPNFFPTAGAALSDKICGTIRKIGIDLIYGYGMTETTATISCYPSVNYQIGTVGTPLPMVDVKIDDNGEILVKGPTVTSGYYNNPEATATAFTPDGYLRTGDAGYINERGAIVLTHRIKDMFKTSNGKYISPQAIETLLVADPYIDQAAVIGDSRKYVSALIVPDFHALRRYAEKEGILDLKSESLCQNEKIKEFYLRRVQNDQKGMASFEMIKKITLLPEPFSQEAGEITNTLKLRRPVISQNYEKEIEAMYPDEFLSTPPFFNNRHR